MVLLDYRGYGDAPGRPSPVGLETDARAVGRFLDERGSDPVVYFGESLGAALAVYLAGERPPVALVLRSPFSSLVDVAGVHYPILPVRLLLWDQFEAAGPIGHLDVPVLVIAGEDDSIVPLRQSRGVFEAASEPKEMIVVDGARHNDPELAAGPSLGPTVRRFLDDTTGSPPPDATSETRGFLSIRDSDSCGRRRPARATRPRVAPSGRDAPDSPHASRSPGSPWPHRVERAAAGNGLA